MSSAVTSLGGNKFKIKLSVKKSEKPDDKSKLEISSEDEGVVIDEDKLSEYSDTGSGFDEDVEEDFDISDDEAVEKPKSTKKRNKLRKRSRTKQAQQASDTQASRKDPEIADVNQSQELCLKPSVAVDVPPAAGSGLLGVRGEELLLPQKYKMLQDLTAEERILIDHFARSKKIVLKKAGVRQEAINRAREELELKRREIERESRNQHIKRPRPHVHPGGYNNFSWKGGNRPVPPVTQGSHMPDSGTSGSVSTASLKPNVNSAFLSFDSEGILHDKDWNSLGQSKPLIIPLPKLTDKLEPNEAPPRRTSGNTLVIWATMPNDSERFSFNINPTANYGKDDPKTVVLYQFNPRIGYGKNSILQNHFFGGEWGRSDRSIQKTPIEKGRQFQLVVCIDSTGFNIFVNGAKVSTFQNRCEPEFLMTNATLYFVVPAIEEYYGDDEIVTVHRVWWGHTSMAVRGASEMTNPQISTKTEPKS